MRPWFLALARIALAVSVLLAFGPAVARAMPSDAHGWGQLSGLRLPFVLNQGQIDARVAFYAQSFAGTLFVTHQGDLVYGLPGWTLSERLRGGRIRPVGQERSETGVSCFLGDDPARWRPAVPTYQALGLGEVWPGIVVSVRAHGRGIEKVFTVRPRASVARIRVRVDGATALAIGRDGTLVAQTGLGPVSFTAPVAYQEHDGGRHAVAVAYRVRGRDYGFTVGRHDPALPLVIDPLLQSTYLGSVGVDEAHAVAIHPLTGDVYVAGSTSSTDFPGTAGGAQPTNAFFRVAFVARLSKTLTSLTQATYLGGNNDNQAFALAIDPTTGSVYVTGSTYSTNFPGTAGGAQPASGGGFQDAFVARLTSSLTSLTQATYLGGGNADQANALAIDPVTAHVYVAGYTYSTDFPGTPGGAQPTSGGGQHAFVARISSELTSLIQTTYLSDCPVSALAIHPTNGDVYVAGSAGPDLPGTSGGAQPDYGGNVDACVARLSGALTTLVQATYLGGSDGDQGRGLAIHATSGDVYVTGGTSSTDFPRTGGGAQATHRGVGDVFVARLTATLTSLIQTTYIGGSDGEGGRALAIHPTTGEVYVAGATYSSDFPGVGGGIQSAFGNADAFVARLSSTLTSLVQSTYLGGSRFDIAEALAIDPTSGDVYVVGSTLSEDFPGTGGGAQPIFGNLGATPRSFATDAFLTRTTFSLARTDPPLTLTASVNQPTFALGQPLSAGGAVVNRGLPLSADFYVGILRPDASIQFFTGTGSVLASSADVASYRPLAVGISLGTPFSVTAPTFYVHQWAANEPPGAYLFFVAAVKTGALASGTVTDDQVLGLATAPFSLR